MTVRIAGDMLSTQSLALWHFSHHRLYNSLRNLNIEEAEMPFHVTDVCTRKFASALHPSLATMLVQVEWDSSREARDVLAVESEATKATQI